MHKVLDRLGKVHAECERTDALAKVRRLSVRPGDSDSSNWGYSDHFIPRKDSTKPLRVGFVRDVFLLPDSNIEYDYVLGLTDEFQIGRGQLVVAYRLEFSHEFDDDHNPTTYDFPVTIFWEAVSGMWKASAEIRHGEEKESGYVPPESWTAILAACGLDEFGQLATGISKERAHLLINGMMDIVVAHGASHKQLKRRALHG